MIPKRNRYSPRFRPRSTRTATVAMNNPVRRATRADDFLNGLNVKNLAAKRAFCAAVCIQDVVVDRWFRDQFILK